jgi:hypothetical protein
MNCTVQDSSSNSNTFVKDLRYIINFNGGIVFDLHNFFLNTTITIIMKYLYITGIQV